GSQQPPPGRGAASAVAALATLSWQLRQAAESLLLLGRGIFLLHPSFPPALLHTLSRPLCRDRREHLGQLKIDAERPQETCTTRSASRPCGGHKFFTLLPHKTNKDLGLYPEELKARSWRNMGMPTFKAT
ncbi:unnamed protein product, partial [Gulo gulo]